MAVAFDAKTATVKTVSAATMTIANLTVGAGSNRAMALLIHWATGTMPSGITATWDSGGTNQSMTLVTGTNASYGGSSDSVSIFGLIAPTSGNKNLVVSWTGSVEAHATAISFTGVDQTSVAVAFPHGTTNLPASSTASPASVTVTSATGNMTIAGFSEHVAAYGTVSGTTIAKDDTTGPAQAVVYNYDNGAATVTMTAAFSGSDVWSAFGCDILAAGGGGSNTNKTVTATCTTTSVLIRSVGTHYLATCTSTSTLIKQPRKTLLAICTSTAALFKSILKPLAATCTSTSVLVRSIGKTLSATCTSTVAKIVNFIAGGGTLYNKTVTATCTSTSTLVKKSAFARSLTATCTSTSLAIKGTSKVLVAACTSTSLAIKGTSKVLAATCTSNSVLVKSVLKTLAATCTSTSSAVAHKCIKYTQTVIATCTSSAVVSAIKQALGSVASLASKLRPYKPQTAPVIPGSDTLYLLNELQKVSNAFNAHVAATKDLDARLKAAGF